MVDILFLPEHSGSKWHCQGDGWIGECWGNWGCLAGASSASLEMDKKPILFVFLTIDSVWNSYAFYSDTVKEKHTLFNFVF